MDIFQKFTGHFPALCHQSVDLYWNQRVDSAAAGCLASLYQLWWYCVTLLHTHTARFCHSNGCFGPLKYISYNSSRSSLQLHS